jgi:hypothetical protein
MASFRKMRSFIRLVQYMREENLLDEDIVAEVERYGSAYEWPTEKDVIEKFTGQNREMTERQSREICEDCKEYRYVEHTRQMTLGLEYGLLITPQGRHFLLKLGLIRDWAKDNDKWLNIVLGVVLSTVFWGAIIFILKYIIKV